MVATCFVQCGSKTTLGLTKPRIRFFKYLFSRGEDLKSQFEFGRIFSDGRVNFGQITLR